jgi:hypothetical protein
MVRRKYTSLEGVTLSTLGGVLKLIVGISNVIAQQLQGSRDTASQPHTVNRRS